MFNLQICATIGLLVCSDNTDSPHTTHSTSDESDVERLKEQWKGFLRLCTSVLRMESFSELRLLEPEAMRRCTLFSIVVRSEYGIVHIVVSETVST
jgi:hypothetical protein